MDPDSRANKKVSEYSHVIVTGGSSGLGKTIIERVLVIGSGPSICNLSRSKPTSFLIDQGVTHLECDLSDRQQRTQVFAKLLDVIQNSDKKGPILLVNNSGFGLYDRIENNQVQEHLELIEVNIASLLELTHLFLPLIKRRGGAVMNIASTSAFQPTPFIATYGASKAFVLNWTLALNEELRGTDAHAIAVCPGPTRTNFFKRAGLTQRVIPDGYSHDPEDVIKQAFRALAQKRPIVVTGKINKLLSAFASRLPIALSTRIARRVISRYRNLDS